MKITNKILNDRRARVKRSATEGTKPLSDHREEAQLYNGGSSNAIEQQPIIEDGEPEAAGHNTSPKSKMNRAPRHNLNATRGGRVAKAPVKRSRKQATRNAATLDASIGSQVPAPNHHLTTASTLPAVTGPQKDGGGIHAMLVRPLEPQERDDNYQNTIKSLLANMGNQVN